MKPNDLDRRAFSKLTMAAFGGLMGGTLAGCKNEDAGTTPTSSAPAGHDADVAPPSGDADTMTVAAHACRGLNDCKGEGHECAGQSECATKAWHHECGGHNECKGQGGCGSNPLKNECKGQGGCQIPLMDKVWDQARKDFEARRKEKSLSFGDAPAKKS